MTVDEIKEFLEKPEVKEILKGLEFKKVMERVKLQKNSTLNKYKYLNTIAKKGEILFVGSSLMEQFPSDEIQLGLGLNNIIYNRGISGYVAIELLENIETCIFVLEPKKIFINIGSNDIGAIENGVYKIDALLETYKAILEQVKNRLPKCEVFVMGYYPVNIEYDFGIDKFYKDMMFKTRTNENIDIANKEIEQLAKSFEYNYINVNEGLTDEKGNLKEEFSVEGLHLLPNAYIVILDNLKKYIIK